MAAKIYFRSGLTGGTSGDLDGIDGAVLADGDSAIVVDYINTATYFYAVDADSGVAESAPDVIKPDINAENKRWLLQGTYQNKIRDRTIFIQSDEPADGESAQGDVWIDTT